MPILNTWLILTYFELVLAFQVLLSRLRLFLSPGYPYEETLRMFHNQTSLIMCSYLPVFKSFNRTKGINCQVAKSHLSPIENVLNFLAPQVVWYSWITGCHSLYSMWPMLHSLLLYLVTISRLQIPLGGIAAPISTQLRFFAVLQGLR
jgi:hypothetical protein